MYFPGDCSAAIAAIVTPLSRALFVDGVQALPGGTGSIGNPFPSIQAALDFIGPPTSSATELDEWRVLVIPRPVPESFNVPPRRRIFLDHLGGTEELGNINWPDDVNVGFGADFAALLLDGFTVTGGVVMSDGGNAGTVSILATGSTIFNFGIDATAHVAAGSFAGIFAGAGGQISDVDAPFGSLQSGAETEWIGNVNAAVLGRFDGALIGLPTGPRTWNISSGGGGNTLIFVGCQFRAPAPGAFVLNGPAGSFGFDGVSNYTFKQAPCTLTNPPKIVTEDLIP